MDFVSLLVKRYVGPVATRALWQWAGGRDGDLAFVDEPAAQWSALWARAAAGPVTRIALVREALFDSPGDPELLAALAALAERPPDAAVLELVEALESLLNHGCEDAALWLCLAGFKPRGFDVTYAALAAAVEGRLAPGAREALEAVLPRLLTAEAIPEFPAAADGMRKRLSSAPASGVCAALPAVRRFGQRLNALAEAPKAQRAELIAALADGLEPGRSSASPEVAAVAQALARQLVILQKLGSQKLDQGSAQGPLAELPRALRAALWSTRPAA